MLSLFLPIIFTQTEPELIDQDQNKRKLDTDLFFLRCDFRILSLITADALYQETRTKVTKLFYYKGVVTEKYRPFLWWY